MKKLKRFVIKQQLTYVDTKKELRSGHQDTCWFWWTFPTLSGMGFSDKTEAYSLADVSEATAYFEDPVLGRRLVECIQLLIESGKHPAAVFGDMNAEKFHSCLTLFSKVDTAEDVVIGTALSKFYMSKLHTKTEAQL